MLINEVAKDRIDRIGFNSIITISIINRTQLINQFQLISINRGERNERERNRSHFTRKRERERREELKDEKRRKKLSKRKN